MNKHSSNAANGKAAFFRIIHHPLKYRMFLLTKLPSAYFAGLKVEGVDAKACTVSVPFKWFTQNPFRSTYFACLAMAAEMSTGILALSNLYQRRPGSSMLVTDMKAQYFKKATGKTFFTCEDGEAIEQTISQAYTSLQPQSITVQSRGFNSSNDLVAQFWFTWSFKVKQ